MMTELQEIVQQFWPEGADADMRQELAEAVESYVAAGFVSRAEHQETVAGLEADVLRWQEDMQRLAEDNAQRAYQRELEYLAETALREAGAKNLRAARALLDLDALAADDAAAVIRQQVAELAQTSESAFLFGARDADMGGAWSGFVPAAAGDQVSDDGNGGFRLRLDRAREQGDGLSVIRLKQEAAREGFII